MLTVSLTLAALAAPAPTPTPSGSPKPAASAKATSASTTVVCTREPVTGTRLMRKVCMTKVDRDARTAADQAALGEARSAATTYSLEH